MSWSGQQMRRLLACLDRPQDLVRSHLGLQLQEALGADSIREAVLWLVNRAFQEPTPHHALLRDIITRCDVEGQKGSHVARALNVSARTFFRLRADAIAMLEQTAEQLLRRPEQRTDFKYEISRMISPVQPQTAAHLLEREADRVGSRAAYDAVCACARNGQEVPATLLDKCVGYWKPLAQLEIARTNLNHGDPERYQAVRPAILEALAGLTGAARTRVAFELAYVDRLNAIRQCDIQASADATARLRKEAGTDLRLQALALVCQAEQACDEGELGVASALLDELQTICLRLNDFRIYARTSHVTSILKLLQGNYAEARDLCDVTVAALGNVEPEFAACASALAGRADLLLGNTWERPGELCKRFPQSYVTALIDAVWARHVASSDAKRALAIAQRSADLASAQGARGVGAYASGTLAIVYEFLGNTEDARRQRVLTWELGVQLRRPFYLYDLLVHPALPGNAVSAFDLDEFTIAVLSRRFVELLADAGENPGPRWATAALVKCLEAALGQVARKRLSLPLRDRAHETSPSARRAAPLQRQVLTPCLDQIAVEIAYWLPPAHRSGFTSRFLAAASDLFEARPA